jgi:alkylation response protein AidB-like acyl-CoA dehydrogenase
MLTVEFSPEQRAFAESISAMLERHAQSRGPCSPEVWSALTEIGLIGLGTQRVGGEPLDMVAGMLAVGAAGCQGPFIGAALASRLAPKLHVEIEPGQHGVLISDGIAAWPGQASVAIEFAPNGSAAVVEIVNSTPLRTLSDEPWARVATRTLHPIEDAVADVAFGELARAAWIIGAAESLIRLAAEHAGHRRQFGKAIGDFQAVAHPLANAAAEVGSARDLLLLAAWRLEVDSDPAPSAGASLAATRAGLVAAYASHQAHGAIGYTVERGLDRWSAAIRQISLHPPHPDIARSISLAGWRT